MKNRGHPIVPITDSDIEAYAERMSSLESEALRSLIHSSDRQLEYIDMLSGNLVAQLLKSLIIASGAKRVLEIGTFTGYSAISMAEAMDADSEIITVEMNLKYQKIAEEHISQFDPEGIITLLKGNAMDVLDDLEGKFDLIYLDADKKRYKEYLEKLIPFMHKRSLLIVDNVLWDGRVLDPDDEKTRDIHLFNQMVAEDNRVEQVLLPIRDGVTIIRLNQG